jgi:hypothetical protein
VTPVERYLGFLDDGDFVAAAAVFSEDAIYVRPRFQAAQDGRAPTFGGLVLVRGRAAILESFRKRGKQSYRHVILATASVGSRCFVEMTLGDYGSSLESVAVAELEGSLIKRYVALSAEVDPETALQVFPPGTSS